MCPVSFGIGLEAVSFGAVVGLILGILAALKKNSWLDTICTVISVLGVSLPSYVFALVMAYFIGYKAQWLPLLFDGKKFFASSIMPMLALSMFTVATVARFTRTSLLEVLDSDYMLLAESKGITGRPLLVRHALRNALIPIITVLAPLVVDLMIGSLGYREDLLDSGHRKLNDCSDSVQRLQRDDFAGIYLQCHVHCPDAGG